MYESGQEEGERLAGAGLGDADTVEALEQDGPHLGLDGRGLLEVLAPTLVEYLGEAAEGLIDALDRLGYVLEQVVVDLLGRALVLVLVVGLDRVAELLLLEQLDHDVEVLLAVLLDLVAAHRRYLRIFHVEVLDHRRMVLELAKILQRLSAHRVPVDAESTAAAAAARRLGGRLLERGRGRLEVRPLTLLRR